MTDKKSMYGQQATAHDPHQLPDTHTVPDHVLAEGVSVDVAQLKRDIAAVKRDQANLMKQMKAITSVLNGINNSINVIKNKL